MLHGGNGFVFWKPETEIKDIKRIENNPFCLISPGYISPTNWFSLYFCLKKSLYSAARYLFNPFDFLAPMKKLTPVLFTLLILMACKADPCASINCLNGGTCNTEGQCECPEGFDGQQCEIFDIQTYIGTYRVEYENCFSTNENHTVGIEPVEGVATALYLRDLGDYACPDTTVRVRMDIATRTATIEEQTIDCGPLAYTFSGGGSFDETGTLSLAFSVSYESDGVSRTDNCTATLDKQ